MAIKDYSTTPDFNTSISGINIAEGCAPSGINNAIRQLMADVKAEKDARDVELAANAASQSTRDAQQDSAIQQAASAAENAAKASLISAVIEDGELVLTYGNGTTKRESLPGGLPLGTLMPYTGKDVPAGFLRADGSTYSNMQSAFPEFYDWVVQSGLTVPLASYTLVEGSCGFYGLDTSTGTVRMPTLASGVGGTTVAGQYGQAVQAGLPNITGSFATEINSDASKLTGAMYLIGETKGPISSGSGNDDSIGFDASLSSPIYGASDTVQPPHVKYPWIIAVYNAAVAPSVAQASGFVGLLDGKADKDKTVFSVNGELPDDAGNVAAYPTVDYSAGVDISSGYTVPKAGIIAVAFQQNTNTGTLIFYINGVIVARIGSGHQYVDASISGEYIVTKGDVITWDKDSMIYSAAKVAKFFPFK